MESWNRRTWLAIFSIIYICNVQATYFDGKDCDNDGQYFHCGPNNAQVAAFFNPAKTASGSRQTLNTKTGEQSPQQSNQPRSIAVAHHGMRTISGGHSNRLSQAFRHQTAQAMGVEQQRSGAISSVTADGSNYHSKARDSPTTERVSRIEQSDRELIELYKKIKNLKHHKKNVKMAPQFSSRIIVDPKCNDKAMRAAIIENMHSNPAIAKRQIQAAVREKVDGSIDAICSSSSFSYLVNTDLYCEVETPEVTCLVFRQAS